MKIPILNLLPPDRAQRLKSERLYLVLRGLVIGVGIFVLLVAGALFGASFLLEDKLMNLRTEVSALQQQNIEEAGTTIEQEIRTFNILLTRVESLQSSYRPISPILQELFLSISPGIWLGNLQVDVQKKTLQLEGVALNRDALLRLQSSLEESSQFANPTSPLSNLLQRENIDFTMTVEWEGVS